MLRRIPVDFLAVETTNECCRATLEHKTDAVIANPNAIIFTCGFGAFALRNFLKSSRGFHSSGSVSASFNPVGMQCL